MVTHGHASRKHRSPTYISYLSMRARVLYPSHPYYADYGGRGVTICDHWLGPQGFIHFLADMGERPAGMTLDRIDVNGHYEPGNCRWSTLIGQRWNRRDMLKPAGRINFECINGLPDREPVEMPF